MSTSTATDTVTVTKTKTVQLWRVILLNDDYTPMDFVIQVLTQLYHKNEEEAEDITMAIHHQGRGVAGIYTQEIAMQKANDTIKVARMNGHPLTAVAEEA